jgi:D-alanyl-D-alanine carboxypeptidase
VALRRGRAFGWCAALVAVAGCAAADPAAAPEGSTSRPNAPAATADASPTAPVPSTTTTTPSATPIPEGPAATAPTPTGWVLGGRALPQNPDGSVPPQETPPELRDRRLPTVDLLPPPTDGRFASSIGTITPAVRERMGTAWSPGCPVPLEDLRHLTVSFWGFDDRPHTGEMVVNAAVAEQVAEIFRELFEARFPIEEMRLVTTADLEAAPTGDGNNTAAFVCRAARGSTAYSEHAYGFAVDVNPFQNPYVRGDVVLPELARAYTDRSLLRPGMLVLGEPAVTAFTRRGWEWGGTWRTVRDPMHFSARGG